MYDYISHYGTPHDGLTPHSGRYPYGSGDDPNQRYYDFQSQVKDLRASGEFKNDTEIAKALGMTSSQFRAFTSISKDAIRKHEINQVKKLKDKGMSNMAIAEQLGLSSESQVRSLLKQDESGRPDKTKEVAEILKKQVAEKKYLDVGTGVENQLGISADKLKVATAMLEDQGYTVQNIYVEQATNPGKKTTVKVLTKNDVSKRELYENRDQIRSVTGYYTEDDGRSIRNVERPVAVDPKRVMIRYADDKDPNGVPGVARDGVIELRRGVDDISLGKAHYAQVRINVGDKNYAKGMAVYGNDKEFPPGVDIIFNTNKTSDHPMLGSKADDPVLKPLKKDKATGETDWDNPFGATIKNDEDLILAQKHYKGKDGKEHQSALNIVNEEGNWGEWKKTIASQMLGKQPVETAKRQLKLASDRSRLELDEIEACNNPVIKKKLLEKYAEGADQAAVELKGAKFPRQAAQVIIPINSLKKNEIYAPNYKDGEEVILIRYPHAGTFEIPRLKVNNKNKEGRETITPNAVDAVGIHHEVAAQLSGADFDGDTVLVIPTKGQNLKSKKIQEIIDFEPQVSYAAYDGMPEVSKATGFQKQKQMGMVSNLITDMTIKGASQSEIIRAVKHSMVIIDAEKHNLNWRQSEKDFGIDELKRKYQYKGVDPETGREKIGGASTLLSRAKSDKRVPERRDWMPSKRTIDPETGEKIYTETGRSYEKVKKTTDPITGKTTYTPTGKTIMYQSKTTQMSDTNDARTLISSANSPMERAYADYANKEKSYANEARKALITLQMPKRDPAAAKKYAAEVASLDNKLTVALANAPRERQAQLVASKNIEAVKKSNPDMEKDDLKKVKNQMIASARKRVGASKQARTIEITEKEYEAIQHNAISASKLDKILDNTDIDAVRKYAIPKDNKKLNNAKITRIKALAARGYSNAEIADDLGISTSTVSSYLTS